MTQLSVLHGQSVLTDLDVHFARLMCRLAGDSSELALGAALVSNRTTNGHVCLNLAVEAGQRGIDTPPLNHWQTVLRKSSVVGQPGDYCPLILDETGRLYLYRYWEYEQELAAALTERAGQLDDAVDEEQLRSGLNQLFPAASDGEVDWQKLAAAAAVINRFSVISGGPGTGKTNTVIRILALLRQQPGGMDLNIALAAPTGKAAARLQESIHQAKQGLAVDDAVREAIPEQASTLHRLLGANPDSVYFRHNRDNPLPVNVLILDEASMVDIALMAKLMRALPQQAKLVMLGDKDQLASVEAGAILADICGNNPGYSTDFTARLTALSGENLPQQKTPVPPISDSIMLLRRSYRFGEKSGIGQLAAAVNQGRGEQCLALIQDDDYPDISQISDHESIAQQAAMIYRGYLERLKEGAAAGAVFEAFNSFRVLCAIRHGPVGVALLNRDIEACLAGWGLVDVSDIYYAGRPIIITRNDHSLQLYNGDVGILLPDPDSGGLIRACFQGSDEVIRKVAPVRLPEHETVYAMTVHKSQGSEFDRVLLVLPDEDVPVLSRELLYTGITRARSRFEISALSGVMQAAVARQLHRSSGLGDLLWL
ncbi:Exodeoxyribonuclease V alpha chain [hydrothermal vent metagenome]|uniref:Exodeoxyribonuclease V alpha chain n=1 Tax=hydrothermal vent metagenome TaxID=652676 RepID=A0A3B1AKC8_9ZZZZ